MHGLGGLEDPAVVTGGLAYLRLQGWPSGRSAGSYPGRELERRATWLHQAHPGEACVHAFFNNDIGGAAPRDAARLAGLLGCASPAPAQGGAAS